MLFVNRWRMDLIFLISGLSVHFLLRDTSIGRFVALRSWRLLLPLVFGCLVVVPIQPYAQGVANGAVEPGFVRFLGDYFGDTTWPAEAFDGWEHGFTWNHLWYLAYLWVYTLALALLLPLLRSRHGQRLRLLLTGLRGWKLLLLPAIPLALATITLQPWFEDTGDLVNDWYRHAIYFTVFLYGYWIGTDRGLWAELLRLRKRSLGWALGLFAVYIVLVELLPEDGPDWLEMTVWTLRNLYIWAALSAILGWAHATLNRPLRWLPWANEAVYPWYVLHQSLIVLAAYWLLPWQLGPVLEPMLVLSATVLGCWALHALVIRPSRLLRPCFGLKAVAATRQSGRPTEATRAARPAAAGSVMPGAGRRPLRRRPRLREQETLAPLATHLHQVLALLAGLDAFGDDLHAEGVRQREHGPHDRGAAAVAAGVQRAHERAVDLERMQGEAVQVAQRGIAGAEIVQRRVDAGAAQRVERGEHLVGVVEQRALGHFQPHPMRRQVVGGEQVQQLLRKRRGTEMPRRDVDGDVATVHVEGRDLAAGLVEHLPVDLFDAAALLGNVEEVPRQQQAALWMTPAQQRLVADHCWSRNRTIGWKCGSNSERWIARRRSPSRSSRRSASKCRRSSNISKRCRPCALARYMATSASRSSSSALP